MLQQSLRISFFRSTKENERGFASERAAEEILVLL